MKALLEAILPVFLHPKYKDNHRYRKIYRSYTEALKDCDRDGYENEAIVDVVFQKTRTYIQKTGARKIGIQELAILQSLISSIKEQNANQPVRVLDFGGACGLHYFEIKQLVKPGTPLLWCVVETTEMVKKAQEITSFGQGELHFFSTVEEAKNFAGGFEVVHTSGTLQAVPDPWHYLDKLIGLEAKCLILNRLGMNQGSEDLFTVHHAKLSWNGKGPLPEGVKDRRISYPFGFFSEERLLKTLLERYEIDHQLEDASGSFPVNDYKIVGYGLSCRLKE